MRVILAPSCIPSELRDRKDEISYKLIYGDIVEVITASNDFRGRDRWERLPTVPGAAQEADMAQHVLSAGMSDFSVGERVAVDRAAELLMISVRSNSRTSGFVYPGSGEAPGGGS